MSHENPDSGIAAGTLRELERDARSELEDLYLEPVLRVDLRYRFG